MFRAWITSCVSCLWAQADQESKRPEPRRHIGVEREMEICQSQPHLVPPMKLVFYGDLPSPGGYDQSRSSTTLLPPWIQETRNLASRASQRASVLLTRKKTQSRPVIGAPTDFRRVEPISRRRSFRPLELSIYLPGNRLSNLPEFSRFDLDTPGQPSPPAKALISPFDSSGYLRRDSGPFQLSRKPVGSAPSRRSSLATVDLQLQSAQSLRQRRQSMDAILTSPLIPHFSMVNIATRHASSLPSQNKQLPTDNVNIEDRPSSSRKSTVSTMTRGSHDHQRTSSYITGKRQPGQTQPFTPTSASRNTTPSINHHSAKSSSSTFQSHSRMRTTSNSTSSSRTPSLSSAITAATTIFPSEKELDTPFTTALPMIPASIKNSIVIEEPHVLDEQHALSARGYEFDQRFPLSPVGVAF